MVSQEYRHPLDELPHGSTARSVSALPVRVGDTAALRVELLDAITASGSAGRDYIDEPTFLELPARLRTGTIEVEVRSRLNCKTDFDARGFAGIAYRITSAPRCFEAVYLRPLNGIRLEPDPPRNARAVQYFAYPGWKFDRLRSDYPDGRYEAGADIEPGRWIALRVEVGARSACVDVDGRRVLEVAEPRSEPVEGAVGLFVDIGTVAEFRHLRVVPDR